LSVPQLANNHSESTRRFEFVITSSVEMPSLRAVCKEGEACLQAVLGETQGWIIANEFLAIRAKDRAPKVYKTP